MREHDTGHHASADDEYAATPPGAGHEHTDVDIGMIVKFAVWLLVSGIVVHFGAGLMFGVFVDRFEPRSEAQYPLAATEGLRLPAAPRLQAQPANEIHEFRLRERAVLEGYGWVDRGQGVVHIPIEEAMRLTVERGLPARTPAPDGAADAAGPSVGGALVPADASAGRTMERRRQ
jgi:hypothetical protein